MLKRYFPVFGWVRTYDRDTFTSDALAAVIVTIMLIPQSLAYALLAGLPPEVGLYASIAPLLVYAVFGTSMALAVGPVAVASLMTAAAVGELAQRGTPEYLGAAILLAFLSGLMLMAMGLFRLGFLANFLSHPVISGFITASAILIGVSQLKHILGVKVQGDTLIEMIHSLVSSIGTLNSVTLAIGLFALGFLVWARRSLAATLRWAGVGARAAANLAKAGPVAAVILTTLAVSIFGLDAAGVAIVGDIPTGLPAPTLPVFDAALWSTLAVPALMISIVGYVETISVAQTLAAKRRQSVDPNQELVALGAANIGSAVSGGFPVTGGFSRSVVNFDAGARTPAAGAMTAIMIALVTLSLTPALHDLPKATLAATIIVAVTSLVDIGTIRRTWTASRADFAAMMATILVTLGLGVETGVTVGVALSLALYLYRTSRPHVAVVGRVPGTEHFRNFLRHEVEQTPGILSLRVDESLYFPNARFLGDTLLDAVASDPAIRHVILMCPAVNHVDASAIESLEQIDHRLADARVTFHLSEVKGPVMDRLRRTGFIDHLSGEVFLTHFQAVETLKTRLARDEDPIPAAAE